MNKNLILFSNVVLVLILADSIRDDSLHTIEAKQKIVTQDDVNRVARQLIAPCCWTQTVDVHPSAASDKIKAEIVTLLKEGKTDDEIVDRFVAEYGERIRAIPKPAGFNLLLWILPASVLLIGGLIIALYLRYVARHAVGPKTVSDTPISESDLKRVESELKDWES